MAIQPVVQEPAKILRTPLEPITDFTPGRLQSLIQHMRDTLKAQDGAGIAAPQINVSERVFVIPEEYAPPVRRWRNPRSFLQPLYPTVFINPRITHYSQETEIIEEGCLSVKHKFYPCVRSLSVTLEAQDEQGHRFRVQATGLLARILQHETDHLDGILFIDRIYEQLNQKV